MKSKFALLPLIALAFVVTPQSDAAARGAWSDGGKLVAGVDSGNAFALADGRVVSVGIPSVLEWWPATTQVWDPASNSWSAPPSAPALPNLFRATPIQLDDGRILVTGFCRSSCGKGANAEIYDPMTDSWSMPGQMKTGRYGHAAVKLADGRVLVAGGCSAWACAADTASVEIFDPGTNRFTTVRPMKIHRASFTGTLLADGRVLVAGGYNSTGPLTENETFDPVARRWHVNAPMKSVHALHVAALMGDGRVLVAGGDCGISLPGAAADVFNPATGAWKAVGPMSAPREYFAAVTLKDGKVLLAGGLSFNGDLYVSLSSAERFDPKRDRFVKAPSMAHERVEFSMTLMPDGRAMAVGGDAHLSGETRVPGDAEINTP